MLRFNFLSKFSVLIIVVFFLFTIIGTLTHELGHITVAKYFGYETYLSYGSMNYNQRGYTNDKDFNKIKKLLEKYNYADYENWPQELKSKLEVLNTNLQDKYPQNQTHDLWIAIGGPAQTILTSFIGLIILFIRKEKRKLGFKNLDWLAVFMSLFILREVFNFIQSLFDLAINSKSNFYSDEFGISRNLGFNQWIVPSLTLILGLLITYYIIFKIIPLKYRFSFIVSGFVGGILGYAIWFGFLGEALFNSQF